MSEKRIQLNPELTAIAQTYRNETCIADDVLPKVPVNTESFSYIKFDKRDFLSVPETLIGEKGRSNEVEQRGKEDTGKVENHSLKEFISVAEQEENEQSRAKIDLKERATNQLTDLMLLRKEITLAKILNNKQTYGANFKELEENEKINNDDVNALKIIKNASLNMFYKPNKIVTSRRAFSALSMNPYIVDAVGVSGKKAGVATKEQLKNLFEVDDILVGESLHNVAKKGNPADLQACWSDDIVLLYINKNANTKFGTSFGYHAMLEDITVGEYFDEDRGVKGANVIKAYYRALYLITAPDCGYLLKDVLKN